MGFAKPRSKSTSFFLSVSNDKGNRKNQANPKPQAVKKEVMSSKKKQRKYEKESKKNNWRERGDFEIGGGAKLRCPESKN